MSALFAGPIKVKREFFDNEEQRLRGEVSFLDRVSEIKDTLCRYSYLTATDDTTRLYVLNNLALLDIYNFILYCLTEKSQYANTLTKQGLHCSTGQQFIDERNNQLRSLLERPHGNDITDYAQCYARMLQLNRIELENN